MKMTFWEQLSPPDQARVESILEDLATENKLIEGLANFTELAERLDKTRHTVQRHLQTLPDDGWENLRGRKFASEAEAKRLGIQSRGWRYMWLYHARETLAATIFVLAKHEETINKNRSGRHTLYPKRKPAA